LAEFTETFEYDNGELGVTSGAAWASVDSADDIDKVVVFQNSATNDSTTAAVATYLTDEAETAVQEVAAWVTWHEETSTATADVGLMGLPLGALSVYTDVKRGVYARLHWEADSVRTLSIRRQLKNDAADAEVASVDLVLAGGIEAPGYESRMRRISGSDLGVLQQVRLIVTAEPNGMLARVYVNETDDARPTLQATINSDFISPDGVTFGAWWFGFGAASGAKKFECAQIGGADFTALADLIPQEIREDQVTLGELRKRVRNVYDRGQNTDTSDERLDYAINDEIEQTLNRVGNSAWFMRRQEEVAITPDTLGEATMSSKMRRIIQIRDASTGNAIPHALRRLTTDGASVLFFPSTVSGDYLVEYVIRHRQMSSPHHVCPIPREHSEMVVVGAVVRMAESDRNQAMLTSQLGRYQALVDLFQRDVGRYGTLAKKAMQPRLRGPTYVRVPRIGRWM